MNKTPDFQVTEKKSQELKSEMDRLGIFEGDLVEKFIKGSGAGGQKINKTASCVVLTHIPTGIQVKCQKERSQNLNRFFARRELCEAIAKCKGDINTKKQKEITKKQKQKRKRKKRAVEKHKKE